MNTVVLKFFSNLSEIPCTACMDASPLFDPEYFPVIAATLIGFAGLAAALLVPIWRFLNREQEVAEDWTPEAVEKRLRELRTEDVDGEAVDNEEARASAPSSDAPSDTAAGQGAAGQSTAETSASPSH
jgi:hypothetical protein